MGHPRGPVRRWHPRRQVVARRGHQGQATSAIEQRSLDRGARGAVRGARAGKGRAAQGARVHHERPATTGTPQTGVTGGDTRSLEHPGGAIGVVVGGKRGHHRTQERTEGAARTRHRPGP